MVSTFRKCKLPYSLVISTLLILLTGTAVLIGAVKLNDARAAPAPITSNPYDKVAPPPNCTWYAWQRVHDKEGVNLRVTGDASNWINAIQSDGIYTAWSPSRNAWITTQLTHTPAIGDVVVVPKQDNEYAFSNKGHVAYVEKASIGSDIFEVSQQDAGSRPKDTNTRYWSLSKLHKDQNGAEGFIHITSTIASTTTAVGHALSQVGASHSPVIIENANGQEEIFMVGLNAQLYHKWQNSNGSWSGWDSLGGSWPKDPAVIRNGSGVLEVFIVGNSGSDGTATLFHAWQTNASGNSWTGWNPMAGIWPSETPSVTYNGSSEEVFMRGLNAQIYHSWLASSGWTSWYSLGGGAAKDPLAVQNANGLLGVFYIGTNNQLYYNGQNNGGSWNNWTSLGGSWPNNPAVNLNQNGVLEVFAIGNTGSNGAGLFHVWQTSPGSTSWTGWSMMSGNWPAGVPTVTQNKTGELEVFMLGLNNQHLYHAWQTSPGSTNWTSFSDFGASWSRYPVVFKRSNGFLDVFLVGLNSVMYHIPQNADGGWASPSSLDGNWP
jgi:surface antigen